MEKDDNGNGSGNGNGNGKGNNAGEEFEKINIRLKTFTPNNDLADYGTRVFGKDKNHKFRISFGTGTLGQTDVTYFVPHDMEEYEELSTWYHEEKKNLKLAFHMYEFREIRTSKFPVLITDRVKTTLIRYIFENFAQKRGHSDGMAVISIINDIFNSLTRAWEVGYTCPLQNIFIGEDGVVKLPFVQKTSSTKALDTHLKDIMAHLVDQTYARGCGKIKNPDLRMLNAEICGSGSANTKRVLELFKTKKFPLSDYRGIQNFLLENVDFVKDVTVHAHLFGQHMETRLDKDLVFWERNMLRPPKHPNRCDLAWAKVAEIHNRRRGLGNQSSVAPPPRYLYSNSIATQNKNRNCPLQYVQLSRNVRAHQHADEFSPYNPNKIPNPYPPYIQQLSTDDLCHQLCEMYSGVYTAYYLTLCYLEPNNVKLPTWRDME